jgi:hypothetical protein
MPRGRSTLLEERLRILRPINSSTSGCERSFVTPWFARQSIRERLWRTVHSALADPLIGRPTPTVVRATSL